MNTDKIDEAVLALLYLGHWREKPHNVAQSWKSHNWEALARLHEKDLIFDPVNKAKTVSLSEEGLRQAEEAFEKLFGSNSDLD